MKRSEPVIGGGDRLDEQDLDDRFSSFDDMAPEPLELPEEPPAYTQRVIRRSIPTPKPSAKQSGGIGSKLSAITKKLGGAFKGASNPKFNKRDQLPTKIIQFCLVSRGDELTGAQVFESARELGFEYGEMDIFHFREGGATLFSMANLVKPGFFPNEEEADDFSTPGLLLFAQLPGTKDVLTIFSDMLSVADRLSKRLNAEIQDERHSMLTRHSVENLREELLEYRRQIQVLRNRR